MALTSAQLTTLRSHITASADLNVLPNNDDGHFEVARLLNLTASPSYTVWRTETPRENIINAVVWTEYIASASTAERDAFREMVNQDRVNFSLANIVQGFQDIFSGAGKATSRQAVLNAGKRAATRAEKLFATGTGSNGSPGTMAFEGAITVQDVAAARAN